MLGQLSGSSIIKIEPFGSFLFYETEKTWFSVVKNISLLNDVELLIEVENSKQDLTEKTMLIKEFVNEIDLVMEILYTFIHKKCFTCSTKTLDDVKKMYHLCAIELKLDNKTWWIGLEPSFDNKTIYNHFLRFTLVNNEIIWSNIQNKIRKKND